jgi:methionyl-tRNA formyltransferase
VERINPSLAAQVASAPCVLFAYHEMGFACMEALLAMDAPLAAVFTHVDDPHEEIWWRSVADLAKRHAVPIFVPDGFDQTWRERIAAIEPAVIYSFYYRYLIPESILELAPRGAYNMHGSMLPKYRGRAPVNWMLVNGEREAGVTLHQMVARADAGDIIGQRAVAIDDEDTALTLYRKLVPLGVELINEFHPLIVAGTAPRRPMNIAQGSYFGRRRPEDGRIDWTRPARRIFNLVRAVTHPYPGAFVTVDGQKLIVWRASIAAESGNRGAPGTIIGARADGALEIATGEGSITIASVEFEGGGEGPARIVLGDKGRVGGRI